MTFTDTVTGLANRNLFTDRLDQIILDSNSYLHEFSLLFIDLDGFKKLAESYCVDHLKLPVTTSAGISIYPQHNKIDSAYSQSHVCRPKLLCYI